MPRELNIFHNLVDDEPSTTELLCNLMRFTAFRRLLLGRFLTEACAPKIEFEDVATRARLGEGDCPDIVIANSDVYAFLEVKIDTQRGLTQRQRDGSYLKLLSKDRRPERWLVFLVPEGWEFLELTEKLLGGIDNDHPDGVHTRIRFWKRDVLDVIEMSGLQELNQIVSEFTLLLSPQFRLIAFSKEEVRMLVSKELGTAIWKLFGVVEKIREKSKQKGYKQSSTLTGEIYFRNSAGENILWFGVWPDFWKERGFPLSFGVEDRWGEKVVDSFRKAYRAMGRDATDFKFNKGVWTLGWVTDEVLQNDNVADDVWQQIEALLKRIEAEP
jgi:hypothetical protein